MIMLSRTVVSSLALLLLVTILLAKWVTPAAVRAALPLTPPPIAPQAPFGPHTNQPTSPLTTTEAVTITAALSATPTLSTTQVVSVTPISSVTVVVTNAPTITLTPSVTSSVPRAVVITATRTSGILPTVTPTPPALILLPTPTPTRMLTTLPTVAPTVLPTSEATLQPTRTPLATSAPTVTPTGSITPSIMTTAPVTNATVVLPSPFVTVSVPLPASYQAQGSFASQTVYTNSTIAQQQGTFTIVQAAALNEYGANQHYTLSTQRGVDERDEINVYQIDRYIAVSYTGGDWMIIRRDQGSNIVRAIQPITDLAVLFPRIINQAGFVGQEEINGISSLRYRIDDPTGQGARLVQPLLALTGEIRSLRLDVWIAVPGGYVVAYNFQVELAGARVLDAAGNEARADQAVTWTYQLTPSDQPEAIVWPADAPTPDAFPVPGFAVGEFPIPPNSELLALVGGVPDLISALTPVQVDSFYRTELFELGWTVEGEDGLLHCSKEETSFQLLIAEDTATDGTRISILPAK